MPISLVPSFIIFSFTTMITPGPANICSLSATLNYGKRRALIQWRGLFIGFTVISLISVFLIYFVGNTIGNFISWLSYIGAVYLIWLAYQTLKNNTVITEKQAEQNCNFFTGFFLQLTNIKIILFCLTTLGSYVLPYTKNLTDLLLIGCLLPFTGPVCNLIWIFLGSKLINIFKRYKKLINWILAVSLVFCALSLIWPF